MFYSFNLYKFFLYYFEYRCEDNSFIIDKEKLIYSIKKTIDNLNKTDCIDANCFSWYYSNSKDEDFKSINHKIDNIIDLYLTFDYIKDLKNNKYIYNSKNCSNFDTDISPELYTYSQKVFEMMKIYSAKYRFLKIQKNLKNSCKIDKNRKNQLLQKLEDRINSCNVKIKELTQKINKNLKENFTHII